jgi:hypothetical protein
VPLSNALEKMGIQLDSTSLIYRLSYEVLYNILTASGVTTQLLRLIKMCLNKLGVKSA